MMPRRWPRYVRMGVLWKAGRVFVLLSFLSTCLSSPLNYLNSATHSDSGD
jgi:hypothetical protein